LKRARKLAHEKADEEKVGRLFKAAARDYEESVGGEPSNYRMKAASLKSIKRLPFQSICAGRGPSILVSASRSVWFHLSNPACGNGGCAQITVLNSTGILS
jgi:hypothetical protein